MNHEEQEYVAYKKIDLACRRQEKKNFREQHHSLALGSMLNEISRNRYYIEHRDGYCLIKTGWRDFIKTL